MRVSTIVIAGLLSLSIGACGSLNTRPNVPAAHGNFMLSSHTLNGDEATAVAMGGKVFQVSKRTITWDGGGSANMTAGWGLLELVETPGGVVVNLDGVEIAVAK